MRLDPSPFKLSELLIMAEESGRDEWERTAALMALMVNVHCGGKGKAVSPEQFNPYKMKRRPSKNIPIVPITVLKEVFCR